MSVKFDVSTLNWVKAEIDETLNQARIALEAFVESPQDTTQMQFCVLHLHQVFGTLQMVEIYGAAHFAGEMERLAVSLQEQRIEDVEHACEVLMRGILQLPDYLEGLQTGKGDNALALLPLMNEMRRVRGEQGLPEAAFFHPDLSVAAPAPTAASGAALYAAAQKLRPHYQSSLLHLLRGEEVLHSLKTLRALADKLLVSASAPAVRQWLWVFGGFVEALAESAQPMRTTTKPLLSRGEQVLKQLSEGQENEMSAQQLGPLVTCMLFHVAQAEGSGTRLNELKQAFDLENLLAGTTAEEPALGGFNAALKKQLASDLLEDLSAVQDALDVFVRAEQRPAAELAPMAETFTRLASTLGMMGQDALRQSLEQQATVIQQLVEAGSEPGDEALMGVAGAVLAVESALRDWGVVRPLEQADDIAEQVAGDDISPEAEAEHQRVVRQVMREAKTNLLKAKDAVDGFVAAPASATLLEPVPALLSEIIGSLSMLSYRRVAQVLRSCSLYISNDLARGESLPPQEMLDALADALTSVEYYLDAFVESRVHPGMVLEVAERAVAKLGYPVEETAAVTPPADEVEVTAPTEQPDSRIEPEAVAAPEQPVAEETIEVSPPVAPEQATSRPAPARDELDQEIAEIFIEEASEEIAKIGELLPRWRADATDEEALRDMRRSFHTLKGSGRLVGASTIGEFAWAFESMLNRVIDATVKPDNAMFDLLEQAHEALPELLAEFSHGTPIQVDAAWLEQAAQAMSTPGGLQSLLQAAPATTPVPAAEAVSEPEIEVPELDPVLLEIYGNESEGHLVELGRFVSECREEGRCRISEALTRALHTLQGSSRMAGITAVADIASQLEKYAKLLHSAHAPVDADGLAALGDCGTFISEMLAFLGGQTAQPPAGAELLARATALHDAAQGLAEGIEAAPEAGLAQQPEEVTAEPQSAEEAPPLDELLSTIEVEELPGDMEIAGEEMAIEAAPPIEAMPEPESALPLIESEELVDWPAQEEAVVATEEYLEPAAPEPLPDEYDQELLGIFLEEGAEILDASEETLQAWREHPDDRSLVEELQRQLHTLKGGARMAGVTAIGDLSHTLESIFEDVVDGRLTRSKALFDLLPLAHDRLVTMLEQVRRNELPGTANDLIDRIHALARPVPEAGADAAAVGLDDAARQTFLAQGADILANYDVQLRAWAVEEERLAAMEALGQQLQTLREAARTAGVDAVAEVSQSLQALLKGVRDGHVVLGERLFRLLEQGRERLGAMLSQLGEGVSPATEVALLAALEEYLAEQRRDEERDAVVTEDATAAQRREEEEAELARLERDRRRGGRIQHEVVRVRADLLDNLVNVAGEASIYRSRVEQQIGSVNFNLRDFGDILERLREQLRQFSIETEAQIQSRYEEAAVEGHEDFDPLEFDRFTHMQQLSRSTMESLTDLESVRDMLSGLTRETETLLLQQARVNTELQEGLVHTRMVPLVENAPRLRRLVRQTCVEVGKEVELRFQGAEVEMDRHMVERLLAPIEHLLRNALAHGIETPAQRRALGKEAAGHIVIAQAREGSEIILRIIDDGAGIDLDKVRRKAIERGLMKADAGLSDKEVMHFILESGFSTAESLTQVAGRGVGMDVVNSEIKQLGGSLEIDTRQGEGSTFTLRLPLTLSVSRALLVEVGEEIFAVPLISIQGIERLDRDKLQQLLSVENPTYRWLNQEYELLPLGGVLGVPSVTVADEIIKRPLLLTHSGDHYVAWAADNLLGSREIVVKSIGVLSTLRGLSGATILGDGRVALIVDLPMLARLGLAQRSAATIETVAKVEQPVVMVVDDSITVRKVTSRLLERNDMRAVLAKDGIDAIAQLEEVMPDVMLLDIEMPRMDGYELANHIRNNERLKDLPIIMITSRSGEKHRQRAMDIGVDFYMSKPFQEMELLENISTLLKRRRTGQA